MNTSHRKRKRKQPKNMQLDKTMPLGDRTILKAPKIPPSLKERYTIKRTLGSGAFGIVYLAEDKIIGRLVTIKQLFDFFSNDHEIRERFHQEARIAGQLEHPNIVIVYNIENELDSESIIMEYLGGGSLAELMHKQGRIDLRAVTAIMLGIMSGLEAAHNIMVVHRDIKPQNILFGIGSNPKITDFGVAHLPVQAGGVEFLNQGIEENTLIGTPLYMSPEQISLQEVDKRTDLYSAGVIFYEMLTGHKLFVLEKGMSLDVIKHIVSTVPPTPLRNYRKDIPEEIEAVVLKLLEKNPNDRYSDTSEVKKDLIKALAAMTEEFGFDDKNVLLSTPCQVLSSSAAILEDIIYLLLLDGIITVEERSELIRRTERLGLSEIQARAIEEKVRRKLKLPAFSTILRYTEMVEKCYLENNFSELTLKQEEYLKKQQRKFKINDTEALMIRTQISQL